MSRLAELIQTALDYNGNTHTLEDMLRLREEGHVQFWVNDNSALVTEVTQYPQFRALRILLAAGDFNVLTEWEPAVTTFAREQGCKRLEIGGGRPGWARALKGWRILCPVAVKEI